MVHYLTDFGFVFEEKRKESSFQFGQLETYIYSGSSFSIKEAYALVSMTLSNDEELYKRTYDKLQTVMANIGGIVNL